MPQASSKIACIIVDNDPRTNHQLEMEIKKYPDELELVGIHTDYKEGFNRIQQHKPDVIFINITFPYFTGMDMLGNVTVSSTKIIFLAKEMNYVHQSIKASRFDCLLKPLVIPELRRTVKRLKDNPRRKFTDYSSGKSQRVEGYNFIKLSLPTARGCLFISPSNILYCQADQEYTRVVTKDKTHVISKNLKFFETHLDSRRFFRVHKSFVVNLEYIEAYVKSDGGHVVMSDNKVIHIGRSRKLEFSLLMGI